MDATRLSAEEIELQLAEKQAFLRWIKRVVHKVKSEFLKGLPVEEMNSHTLTIKVADMDPEFDIELAITCKRKTPIQ